MDFSGAELRIRHFVRRLPAVCPALGQMRRPRHSSRALLPVQCAFPYAAFVTFVYWLGAGRLKEAFWPGATVPLGRRLIRRQSCGPSN